MKKIVIVGGGIAGLSAGIYAQKYGFESVIYEKHSIVGGQCTGWDRKGYHIDSCIHWLKGTNPNLALYKAWVETGALGPNVKMIHFPYWGVFEIEGITITLWKDAEKLRKELKSISPEDSKLIDELVDVIIATSGVELPAKAPTDMLSFKDLIALGRNSMPLAKAMAKYQSVSCVEYGKRYKHSALQKLFVYSMADGYSITSFILCMSAMCGGDGDLPKGGSRALALRMADKYQQLGGTIITGTKVAEILTEKRNGKETAMGIRLENAKVIKADYVIASNDAYFTLHQLLKNRFRDKQLDSRFADRQTYKLPSSAHVVFAVDDPATQIPRSITFETEPFQVGTRTFHFLLLFNYAYESDFHPQDKSVISVFLDQSDDDYLWWETLHQDPQKYKAAKEQLAKQCEKKILEQYPTLTEKLTLLDVYTPVTYQHFTGTFHGAWMSFLMTPKSKALMHKGIIKGLNNCYMAGMYMMPPGGLPVALISGKFAMQRICKKERIKQEIR